MSDEITKQAQREEEAAAKERERERIDARLEAEAERRPAADRDHRAMVHSEIAADLCDLGLTDAHAAAVIQAVACGAVPRLMILY